MDASKAAQFGALLRQTRKRKGLSQAELGGDRYSDSYISHLESGRRTATPEAIEFLSRRLGVSPLEWGVATGAADPSPDSRYGIEELLLAERAWSDRDWPAAIEHATRAVAIAEQAHDAGRHWEALYVLAQARFASGDFTTAAELAEQLAEHETGGRFPVARAQSLSLASVAHRAADRLGWAVAFAARAVEAASAAPPIIQAEALMALVSAMMEAGHSYEESKPYLERLADVAPDLTSDHSRGMVAWTLGTAAIRGGDAQGGLQYYHQAQQLLDPRRDIRLWLRLHRSYAEAKLDAGDLQGVAELLATASAGLAIAGNRHDLVELRTVEARLALAQADPARASAMIHDVLRDPVLGGADVSHGSLHLVLADAMTQLGRPEAARESYEAAAMALEQEGRLRASLRAWRRAAGKSD